MPRNTNHILFLLITILNIGIGISLTHGIVNKEPKVIIAGGGPGGLMTAILLSQKGIPTTILEQSPEPETLSHKSYSITINERGQEALERAGCLELVQKVGFVHDSILIVNDKSGAVTPIPLGKGRPSIRLDRPSLCKALESVVEKNIHVTMKRGSQVTKIVPSSSSPNSEDELVLQVHLEDGSVLFASHVIGADGKWSNVRKSCSELESQVSVETEGSFSIQMERLGIPEGWNEELIHIIRPKDGKFYIMAVPLINQELSILMICYDEVLKSYPWLAPQEKLEQNWNDIRDNKAKSDAAMNLAPKLKDMLEIEAPAFLAAIGEDALKSARVKHRTPWINMSNPEGTPGNYSTRNGRVALIGDAAHAVVPSTGEGCNMALESAMRLADSINFGQGEEPVSVKALSSGLKTYGSSRPHETLPLQSKAAAAANYETSRFR